MSYKKGYLQRVKEYLFGPKERAVSVTEFNAGQKAIRNLTRRFDEAVEGATRYIPEGQETNIGRGNEGDLEKTVNSSV